MSEFSVILGSNLRFLRNCFELSQAEVADFLNISRSTYTYYELGRTQPSLETLCKIAMLYRISLNDLLGVDAQCDKQLDKRLRTNRKYLDNGVGS